MRKIYLLIFIISNKFLFSQNLSISSKQIYDSILPISDTNYWFAKSMWEKLEKNSPINNRERLLFISNSFKNKDFTFFKKNVKYLIRNDGFEIDNTFSWLSFYNELTSDTELKKWYQKVYKKNHKKWLIKNINKLSTIKIIEQTFVRDQIFASLYSYKLDSCNIKKEINERIKTENITNLYIIADLSKKNGCLINNLDYPSSIIGKIEIVIAHNLLDSSNFENKWSLILPYVEEAYFKGKISDSFFRLYDKLSFDHFGYQYYGTIKNAQIRDIDTFEQRKKKYKL